MPVDAPLGTAARKTPEEPNQTMKVHARRSISVKSIYEYILLMAVGQGVGAQGVGCGWERGCLGVINKCHRLTILLEAAVFLGFTIHIVITIHDLHLDPIMEDNTSYHLTFVSCEVHLNCWVTSAVKDLSGIDTFNFAQPWKNNETEMLSSQKKRVFRIVNQPELWLHRVNALKNNDTRVMDRSVTCSEPWIIPCVIRQLIYIFTRKYIPLVLFHLLWSVIRLHHYTYWDPMYLVGARQLEFSKCCWTHLQNVFQRGKGVHMKSCHYHIQVPIIFLVDCTGFNKIKWMHLFKEA